MTHTTATTYHAGLPDTERVVGEDHDTVTLTMTADEARSVLDALNEPCLQRRAFVGLSDAPFRQRLVEVSEALKEALPNWQCDECKQTIVSSERQSTQHLSNCSLHPDNEVKR